MKRFSFFALFFLLFACAPKVTQTPAASPTMDASFATATNILDVTHTASPTLTETAGAPTPRTDPNAWIELGTNQEILTTDAGMTLWAGTANEQHFALNPDPAVADKLSDGLRTAAVMVNWYGNKQIRDKWGTFDKYSAYIANNPIQAEWMISKVDPNMGDPSGKFHGVFEPVNGGVDLSQIAVRISDAPDNARSEGWTEILGGVAMKMEIQQVDGKNIIQFSIANCLELDDPAYGMLGLSPKNDNKANGIVFTQAINMMINRVIKMANGEPDTVLMSKDHRLMINFAIAPITKSYMNSMAKGTPYIVVEP